MSERPIYTLPKSTKPPPSPAARSRESSPLSTSQRPTYTSQQPVETQTSRSSLRTSSPRKPINAVDFSINANGEYVPDGAPFTITRDEQQLFIQTNTGAKQHVFIPMLQTNGEWIMTQLENNKKVPLQLINDETIISLNEQEIKIGSVTYRINLDGKGLGGAPKNRRRAKGKTQA